jgi:hypothetical protein
MDPLLADIVQRLTGFGQGRALLQVADKFRDVLALKVAAWCDASCGHKVFRIFAQDSSDLARRPDKEPTLLALAVGVLGGVEATLGTEQFTDHIVQDLLGDGAEELVAGDLPGVQVDVCLPAPSSCELS